VPRALGCACASPQTIRLEPPADRRCKRCYGCTVVLSRLPSHDKVMGKNRVARAPPAALRALRYPRTQNTQNLAARAAQRSA
jgi:hypothetical protein